MWSCKIWSDRWSAAFLSLPLFTMQEVFRNRTCFQSDNDRCNTCVYSWRITTQKVQSPWGVTVFQTILFWMRQPGCTVCAWIGRGGGSRRLIGWHHPDQTSSTHILGLTHGMDVWWRYITEIPGGTSTLLISFKWGLKETRARLTSSIKRHNLTFLLLQRRDYQRFFYLSFQNSSICYLLVQNYEEQL